MKEYTKAYVAGLFDAEGTLTIEGTKHFDCVTSYARISFSNTDKRVHEYLVQMFGGEYHEIGRKNSGRPEYWKTEYRWKPTGARHSIWFLSQIKPYVMIKKQELNLLLEYYSMHEDQTSSSTKRRRELVVESARLKNRSVETDTQKSFWSSWKSNLVDAYYAGFFDGDGCATISKSKAKKEGHFLYGGLISLVNTCSLPIYQAEKLYQGRSRLRTEETSNRQASYEWATRNKSLIEIDLLKFIPYLIIKREQAKLLLSYVRQPRFKNIDLNSSQKDFREDFYQRMLRLNHPEQYQEDKIQPDLTSDCKKTQ